jgi:alpha-amylase/alpha-mannosidase (GH57 family)
MTDRRPLTLVLHGHFYQPPREDPRTGAVPVEPSASPWHDWNARITAECYHPNTAAVVVDPHGRVRFLADNYARLSFNVGPTLLDWLEHHAPETYARITSTARVNPGAIAQGFNHAILPLCDDRDRRTQVRWGLRDFEHRTGRRSEGIWLPEAAVDDATLRVLAEEGVAFTVLAPRSAARIRPIDPMGHPDGDWRTVDERTLDSSVLYRWKHPERPGLGVTICFYDGELANRVAFGMTHLSSAQFLDAVVHAADGDGRAGDIVAIATDGETFGHHHKFADRTIAYALGELAAQRGIRVATFGELVAERRPSYEVEVVTSSWSCAHGVERWRSDCPCGMAWTGIHHRWRSPLRQAVELLRDEIRTVFERRGPAVMHDIWAARDAYVDVVIGAAEFVDWIPAWLHDPDDGDARATARVLLEAQRQSMAMETSCGWFFDDIAGIEAIIVLRYAAAAIGLLQSIDEALPTARFEGLLAQAEGNYGRNGLDVWKIDVPASTTGPGSFVPPAGGWAPAVGIDDLAREAVVELRSGDMPNASRLAALLERFGVAPVDS